MEWVYQPLWGDSYDDCFSLDKTCRWKVSWDFLVWHQLTSRFIAGISSGIAICLVPPFLSQIAKASPQLAHRSGQIGTMHQMAIVVGLFTAQAAGMIFTGSVSFQ